MKMLGDSPPLLAKEGLGEVLVGGPAGPSITEVGVLQYTRSSQINATHSEFSLQGR